MKVLSKKDWNTFVDTGKISEDVLQFLASKIRNNIVLSQQEISIYSAHAHCIEKILKIKNKL